MTSTAVFCRLLARSVRNCDRRLASRINRFRYICGGEDGRREVGSAIVDDRRGVLREASRDEASWVALYGGGGCEVLTCAAGVPAIGAPLTTWAWSKADVAILRASAYPHALEWRRGSSRTC